MKYSFKCYKQVHIALSNVVLLSSLLSELILLPGFIYEYHIAILIFSIFFALLPLLTFIWFRVFYSCKYVIDDTYITKYKYKKILFKIKIKDIKYLGIRKRPKFRLFKFIFCMLNYKFNIHYFDTISFIYNQCECVTAYWKFDDEVHLKEFLDNGDDNFEYIDLLPLKDAIKLCNTLDISYKIKEAKD